MSAPFTTSYNDTLKYDIRHIYSGRPVSEMSLRTSRHHDGINVAERMHAQQTRAAVSRIPAKSLEYLPKYRTYLPKAHGFQVLSRAEVDDVISRLNYPRHYLRNSEADEAPSRNKTPHSAPAGGRKTKKTKVTNKQIKAMCERLHSSRLYASRSSYEPESRSKSVMSKEPVDENDL